MNNKANGYSLDDTKNLRVADILPQASIQMINIIDINRDRYNNNAEFKTCF